MEDGAAHPDCRPPTRAGGARTRQPWASPQVHLPSLHPTAAFEPGASASSNGTGAGGTSMAYAVVPEAPHGAAQHGGGGGCSAASTPRASATHSEPGGAAFSSGAGVGGGSGGSTSGGRPTTPNSVLSNIGLPGEEAASIFEPLVIEPYVPYEACAPLDALTPSLSSSSAAASPSAAVSVASPPGEPLTPAAPPYAPPPVSPVSASTSAAASPSLPTAASVGGGERPFSPAYGAVVGGSASSRLSLLVPKPPSSPPSPRQHSLSGRRALGKFVLSPQTPGELGGGFASAMTAAAAASPRCSETALSPAESLVTPTGGGGTAAAADAAEPDGVAALLGGGRPSVRRLLPPLWHASNSSLSLGAADAHLAGDGGGGGADGGAVGGGGTAATEAEGQGSGIPMVPSPPPPLRLPPAPSPSAPVPLPQHQHQQAPPADATAILSVQLCSSPRGMLAPIAVREVLQAHQHQQAQQQQSQSQQQQASQPPSQPLPQPFPQPLSHSQQLTPLPLPLPLSLHRLSCGSHSVDAALDPDDLSNGRDPFGSREPTVVGLRDPKAGSKWATGPVDFVGSTGGPDSGSIPDPLEPSSLSMSVTDRRPTFAVHRGSSSGGGAAAGPVAVRQELEGLVRQDPGLPRGAAAAASAAVRQELEDLVRLRCRSFVLAGAKGLGSADAAAGTPLSGRSSAHGMQPACPLVPASQLPPIPGRGVKAGLASS